MKKKNKILKYLIPLFAVIFISLSNISFSQIYTENLQTAYNLLNSGDYNGALPYFESHVKTYPNDTKVFLQIGYIHNQLRNPQKALEYFDYVVKNSNDPSEVSIAKIEADNIRNKKKNEEFLSISKEDYKAAAYKKINERKYEDAIQYIKKYLNIEPGDTKMWMQLAYLQNQQRHYNDAFNSFYFVANNSRDRYDVDKATLSMGYLRQTMIDKSPRTFDIYFYNYWENYYNMYTSNLLSHINFKVARQSTLGFYTDIFLDSKSKQIPANPDPNVVYIYNDRYVEAGGFFKQNLNSYMNFELRAGYVHEIDYKKSSFNFKPILSIGTRLGQAEFYKSITSVNSENFYMDIYGVGLYDHKQKNFFAQLQLKEALRFLTGGYSYFELYLGQFGSIDSKTYDPNLRNDPNNINTWYNKYVDLSAGVAFKPNLLNFPVLFVEAVNKSYLADEFTGQYFQGNLKSIFQIRAGFLLTYNSRL